VNYFNDHVELEVPMASITINNTILTNPNFLLISFNRPGLVDSGIDPMQVQMVFHDVTGLRFYASHIGGMLLAPRAAISL
jgi:hypothetical protein